MHQTEPTPNPTRGAMRDVGEALRVSLSAVLARVAPQGVRPVTLAKDLKIDDSLAARILRSVRASDPLSVLRELPSPQGIRIFLDATAKRGLPVQLQRAATDAVTRMEDLLEELPLGRASLDTAIDGWLPSGRARAERAGKQAVFKAFSQMLGFTVNTACFAMVIKPSAAGDSCDAMTFVAMDGIRRLREGAPILLFGHSWGANDPTRQGLPPMIVETLDGEREVTDARKLLLPDVGLGAHIPVRMLERGTHTRVVLESSTPQLHAPISTALAYISRNQYRRYRTPESPTESFMNATKVPIRVFVQDLFIHEEAFPGFMPNIVPRMDNLSFNAAARDPEMLDIDRMELEADLERLGWGLDRIGLKEWSGYEPALRAAFKRAGWDPSRFRAYRCYIKYPLPFVSLTTWFDLPAAP